MPGPPFAFGAILVILALMVAIFIPDSESRPHREPKSPSRRGQTPKTTPEKFQLEVRKTSMEKEPLIPEMEEAAWL